MYKIPSFSHCHFLLYISVPLLKDLEESQLQRIADVLEAQFHPEGECIIRQGEQADSFFIIQSGEVSRSVLTHSLYHNRLSKL